MNSRLEMGTGPALDFLDVAGYNYASGRYPKEGQLHPDRLVVGSETFPQDIVKNWRMVEKYPWLCGDFMWTAWDYLGEVGKLLGFGSANPRTEERFDSGSYTTYYGKTMAVVRAGNTGSVTVNVSSGNSILVPIEK